MGLTYFKRFRMEIDLGRQLPEPVPPPGYRLIAWNPHLIVAHAETKYHSFRTEIDANVFPCLGDYDGCVRLMSEIARKDGFLPGAPGCWRSMRSIPTSPTTSPAGCCGTIQGIRDRSGMGAIQNLGIVPEHRGRGLGSCLMLKALAGLSAGTACGGPFWKSPPRTRGPSASIAASASTKPAPSTRLWKPSAMPPADG